jgi:hypothetical protein
VKSKEEGRGKNLLKKREETLRIFLHLCFEVPL